MSQREVPGLGVVTGVAAPELPNVEQYNGIPFGSIPARFRQAKLVTSWPDKKWDGTKYGPICPFPRMAIGHPLTQCKLPPQHDYDMNEFKCLNLNITCPKGAKAGDDLPVMVFVHGGGNVLGMGSDPGYNGGPLVEFSVAKKMPVVTVTINYRMGAFGFLASQDLKDDNEAAGDGGCGNYGTRDQLVAFEWVKKNIKAFGGDPSRVTGAGHSAGSIDVHTIICSELFPQQKPFNQAILQSGVAPMTMRSLNHQQDIYDKITAYVKATGSGKDKIEALRKLPADDLVGAYMALGAPIQSWQATVDGYYIKETIRASGLPAVKYDSGLKRILIGECTEEGRIAAPNVMALKWTYDRVLAAATEHLGKNAEEVLKAYGITADITPDKLIPALFKVITDGEWCQPIEAVAKSFSNGDVFYYNMSELNPFEGPNKGTAHHGVDLLFVFMTYQGHLDAALQKQAEVVAGHWLTFVNGKDPWKPHDGKKDGSSIIMGYGHGGGHGEIADSIKPTFRGLRLAESMQDGIGNFAAALRGETIIE